MTCKLRRWIFNKRHEHLLPTFLLRYEVYTYGKLTSRWTQRPYLNFLRKLRKFWFDHNMATTLDLPLPLNILEDLSSQRLKTSTSFHLKKNSTSNDIATLKKKRRLRSDFYTSKNGHELCSSYISKYQDRLRKHLISSSTSEYWKKKKNRRTSPSLSKTSRFLENEPARKKTTLASPLLPQRKTFFLKTSLGKFWKKIRSLLTWRRSSVTTMRQKRTSEENVIFRGEERSDET